MEQGTVEARDEIRDKGMDRFRVARTVTAIAAWVCMGLYSEMSGPTLPFIRQRIGGGYEMVSRALVARSVGFFAGSILGGVLCDRFMRLVDLWMALALLAAATGTAIAPWCRSLEILGTLFCLDGLGKGLSAAGSNAFILQLWMEKAAIPTHSLHLSFGIGALIAPQIARPFLPLKEVDLATISADNGSLPISTTFSNNTNLNNRSLDTNSSGFVRQEGDMIEYPYAIVAAITLLFALVYLCFQICVPKPAFVTAEKENTSLAHVFNPYGCVRGNRVTGLLIMFGLFFFWGMPIGAERAFSKFLFTFATEGELQMTNTEGATLETIFWVCFVAGRGVAIVLAKFISPTKLIMGDLLINLVASSVLAFGVKNRHVLWVFTAIFAAVMSPIFPASISWANLYIHMTAMATSIAFISCALAAFAFSWIAGALFEYHGPSSLMYFMLAYAVTSLILFMALCILGHKHKAKVEDVGGNPKEEIEVKDEMGTADGVVASDREDDSPALRKITHLKTAS